MTLPNHKNANHMPDSQMLRLTKLQDPTGIGSLLRGLKHNRTGFALKILAEKAITLGTYNI